MTNFQKILFPVDFSERSRAAAPFVLSMAQRYHASVVLLHAINPPPPIYGGMNTIYPEAFDFTEYRTSTMGELEKFGASELPKIDTTCAVDFGDTASIIRDYVVKNAIDLVAMPTHGYGVFRRALLGSVTAKVLHDVKIPVWTSAHAPEQSHRAHPQPRRIIVGLDLEPRCKSTLEAAIQLGQKTGAAVIVVHAVAEGVIIPGMAAAQLKQLLIEGAKEQFAAIYSNAGPAVAAVIEIGSPAALVRNVCLRKRADLVVIGRNHDHSLLGRASTSSIIREAPCPVLSL